MTIPLGKYQFDGPLESVSLIEETEGIFAVICFQEDGTFRLIHIEEANNLKAKIRNHTDSRQWTKMCERRLVFAVNYTQNIQAEDRKIIVNEIKKIFFPSG